MKKLVFIGICLFLAGMTFTLKSQNMTQEQKNSYALGVNLGEHLSSNGISIDDFEAFKEGFTDALKGANKFSPEEMQACFENLNQMAMAKQNQGINAEKEKGKQFLAENKKRKGVIETPSGLQYEVIVMGQGPKPSATDQVKVHYHGTTIDGTVFDSSVQRGEPIVFGLNQVISGWTEGVQLMPVGSKFKFFIPSDLAYGDSGAPGGRIKPGATLIFEVELIDIPK
jgi:FKBP-type peptidyl-prolyl cis-trans isomerase FklB